MKKINQLSDETPSTVTQIAAAMAALGRYTGANSEAEHQAEAARLGDATYYRMMLVNALLGIVQTEAMLADSAGVSAEQMQSAHRQALVSAGAEEDLGKLLGFLRWQTLRIEGSLREIVQDTQTGPIPLAAAHASLGLQLLLGVSAAGQDIENVSPLEMKTDLENARQALTNAVANIDIILQLVAKIEHP